VELELRDVEGEEQLHERQVTPRQMAAAMRWVEYPRLVCTLAAARSEPEMQRAVGRGLHMGQAQRQADEVVDALEKAGRWDGGAFEFAEFHAGVGCMAAAVERRVGLHLRVRAIAECSAPELRMHEAAWADKTEVVCTWSHTQEMLEVLRGRRLHLVHFSMTCGPTSVRDQMNGAADDPRRMERMQVALDDLWSVMATVREVAPWVVTIENVDNALAREDVAVVIDEAIAAAPEFDWKVESTCPARHMGDVNERGRMWLTGTLRATTDGGARGSS
jgi:hypothetical protein